MSKYFSSKNLAIFISVIIVIVHFLIRTFNYNNWSNILGWDVLAYYIYLPFSIIHGDPGISDQSIVQYIFDTYHPSGTFYQAFPLPNGNWSPMYTIGFTILYFPFFIIAHIWALLSSNYPADGFSYPYQFIIGNGVMVYIVSGIFFLRKVLLNFFTDKITFWVLLFMLLGTTFFHEALADECGPHAIMFAGFALILHLNIKWHNNPTSKTAFLLGLTAGLCILARGSGIVIGVISILWGVYNKKTLQNKIQLILQYWKQIVIGVIGLGIFPLIQIIYWKLYTGQFLFNTYMVTPGFDWLDPHFAKVFFSYKKGWFIYTPMMSFVVLGLFTLWKRNKEIAIGIITFFIINVYLISSWGTWWQGGSFGSRYFVDSYPILAIPFGYLLVYVNTRKLLKWIIYPLAGFFLFLNLFQTWQFNNWIFDGYSMTKTYYWKVFLKTKVDPEDRKYREIIRNFKSTESFTNPQDYTKRTIGYLDFEKINTIDVNLGYIDTTNFVSPPSSCKIPVDYVYGPTFRIPWYKLTDREHAWVRVTFEYLPIHDLKEAPASLVIELNHNSGQYIEKYRNWNLEQYSYTVGEWNTFSVDYLTPYPLSAKKDVLNIYVYLRGDKPIYLDNFHVEVFERKW